MKLPAVRCSSCGKLIRRKPNGLVSYYRIELKPVTMFLNEDYVGGYAMDLCHECIELPLRPMLPRKGGVGADVFSLKDKPLAKWIYSTRYSVHDWIDEVLPLLRRIQRMHKPPHPGRVLRDVFERHGDKAKAMRSIGISRTTLRAIIRGKAAITPEYAMGLSRHFGGSTESWLHMQWEYDNWKMQHP